MIATTPSGTRIRCTCSPFGRVHPSVTSPTGSASPATGGGPRPSPAGGRRTGAAGRPRWIAPRPPRRRRRPLRWPRGSRRGGRAAGRRRRAGRRPSPRWRRWRGPGWRPWLGSRARSWRRWAPRECTGRVARGNPPAEGDAGRLWGWGRRRGPLGHDGGRGRDGQRAGRGVPRRSRDGVAVRRRRAPHPGAAAGASSRFEGKRHLHHPTVYTTDDHAGAAFWDPPGHWKTRPLSMLQMAPLMVRSMGPRIPRALEGLGIIETAHGRHPDHYYLAVLGTRPDRQGEGVGGALMAPMLDHCDEHGHRRLPRVVQGGEHPLLPAPRLRGRRGAPAAEGPRALAHVARPAAPVPRDDDRVALDAHAALRRGGGGRARGGQRDRSRASAPMPCARTSPSRRSTSPAASWPPTAARATTSCGSCSPRSVPCWRHGWPAPPPRTCASRA